MKKVEICDVVIHPAKKFSGSPVIPGDKSISHRCLIFSALAEGQTEIHHLLESGDIRSTAECLQKLGIKIIQSKGRTVVHGLGYQKGFMHPDCILDCANSGTTMRLLMGVLSAQNIQVTLSGDHSLNRRPMKRVADPLKKMGAHIVLTQNQYAPLTLVGRRDLQAMDYELPVASAQIKTALILAAIFAEGTTRLTGKIESRDHTERMLPHFGVNLHITPTCIEIPGFQRIQSPSLIRVPGDFSSAAFWVAAACLIPGGELQLENVSLNPSRLGFFRILKKMGASLEIEITSEQPEPMGRINVYAKKGNLLQGISIGKEEIPSLIDEIPLIAVVATQAEGVTEIEGAEELRVKESDRIESIGNNLRAMGAQIEIRPDGFRIEGVQRLQGATVESYDDHRIAMAFSIAALVANGDTRIQNVNCVEISYPNFFATLGELTQ